MVTHFHMNVTPGLILIGTDMDADATTKTTTFGIRSARAERLLQGDTMPGPRKPQLAPASTAAGKHNKPTIDAIYHLVISWFSLVLAAFRADLL